MRSYSLDSLRAFSVDSKDDSLLRLAFAKRPRLYRDEIRSAALLSILIYDTEADISKTTMKRAISSEVKLPMRTSHFNMIMPWKDYNYIPYWLDGLCKFKNNIKSEAGGYGEILSESIGLRKTRSNEKGFKSAIYINKKTNTVYVSFRGTIGMRNTCTDLAGLQVPIHSELIDSSNRSIKVHVGFQSAYFTLRNELKQLLAQAIEEVKNKPTGPAIIATTVDYVEDDVITENVTQSVKDEPPTDPPPPVNPSHVPADETDSSPAQSPPSSVISPPPPPSNPSFSGALSEADSSVDDHIILNPMSSSKKNNSIVTEGEVIETPSSKSLPSPENTPVQVIFTGHSLGGALATIAAVDLKPKILQECEVGCITIGAPAVGNAAFRAYNERLIEKEKGTLRFVNKDDMVPQVLAVSKCFPCCFCTCTPYHHTVRADTLDMTCCSVAYSCLCAVIMAGVTVFMVPGAVCFVCCYGCCYLSSTPTKHVSSSYISNMEKYLHKNRLGHPNPLPVALPPQTVTLV